MASVWRLLTNEADARRAEELVAAAIGADEDAEVLVGELERVCNELLVDDDPAKTARNIVSLLAALSGLTRASLANMAALVADAKDEDANDPAVTRPYEVHLLDTAKQSLLQTLEG